MVTSFQKSTNEKPTLLGHKQVKSFLHEFGHVMHAICSKVRQNLKKLQLKVFPFKTNTTTFHGPTATEGDFVEAPSQMLENWVWQEKSLKMMSGHYKDGSPIPDDLLRSLIASREANQGGKSLLQIFYASFDFLIHTRNKANTHRMSNKLFKKILGIKRIKGANAGATFKHFGK